MANKKEHTYIQKIKTWKDLFSAYTDSATQIPKNASVVIRRIPVGPKGKALTAA